MDQTFTTVSQLTFTASRFENGVTFGCDADNVVMREDSDKPLHDSLLLEVMCKLILLLHNRFSIYNILECIGVLFITSLTFGRINLIPFKKKIFSVFPFRFTDPPVVAVHPDSYTVNETGEIKLGCEYESNPASLKRVIW